MQHPETIASVAITFDRKKGKFSLVYGENRVDQNVCEFLHTFSVMIGTDVEKCLMNTAAEYDVIRVPLTCSGKTITVGIAEFVKLRELYEYQLFLLKLEDVLLRRKIRPADILDCSVRTHIRQV